MSAHVQQQICRFKRDKGDKMYEDVEADFWKEILVTMQQKNMVRKDGESLYFDGAEKAFDDFSKKNPDVKASLEMASSYATCEMEISATIKLRLFIQSQIKGTLLQKNGNDYIKIADAKFPNNPFPEIESFFERRNEYLDALAKLSNESMQNNKKRQVAGEFLKAYISKKFPEAVWTIDPLEDGFLLTVDSDGEKKQRRISLDEIISGCNFPDSLW